MKCKPMHWRFKLWFEMKECPNSLSRLYNLEFNVLYLQVVMSLTDLTEKKNGQRNRTLITLNINSHGALITKVLALP